MYQPRPGSHSAVGEVGETRAGVEPAIRALQGPPEDRPPPRLLQPHQFAAGATRPTTGAGSMAAVGIPSSAAGLPLAARRATSRYVRLQFLTSPAHRSADAHGGGHAASTHPSIPRRGTRAVQAARLAGGQQQWLPSGGEDSRGAGLAAAGLGSARLLGGGGRCGLRGKREADGGSISSHGAPPAGAPARGVPVSVSRGRHEPGRGQSGSPVRPCARHLRGPQATAIAAGRSGAGVGKCSCPHDARGPESHVVNRRPSVRRRTNSLGKCKAERGEKVVLPSSVRQPSFASRWRTGKTSVVR